MTSYVKDVSQLEEIYGKPGQASLVKVASVLTPHYRKWINASKFCVLTTVGPEGTDGSPRGDTEPVVRELDPKTLAMPDWRGNNRMDSLRNIVRDGRFSLMFMVPGSTSVVRINGTAKVSVDQPVIEGFDRNGQAPRSVIIIKIGEIYFQCARALMRSGLWTDTHEIAESLPTAGQMLSEMTDNEIDGAAYDAQWPGRAAATMWSD